MGTNVINSSINKSTNIIYDAISNAVSNTSTVSNCMSKPMNTTSNSTTSTNSNLVNINTEDVVKSFNSTNSQAKINNNINIVSKEISNQTGQNLDKTTSLVKGITDAMSSSFINNCNNTKEIRDLSACANNNKFIIDGTTEESYLKIVKNCISNDANVERAELRMTENLVTSDFSKGLYGAAWWLVIFFIAILLTIIFMVIFGILFIFVFYRPFLALFFILLPAFIVFLLLSIGYFPKWWPYESINESINNSSSNDTNNQKGRNNLIKFIIFGVITLILLFLLILFLFLGMREKKESIVQRMLHKFENTHTIIENKPSQSPIISEAPTRNPPLLNPNSNISNVTTIPNISSLPSSSIPSIPSISSSSIPLSSSSLPNISIQSLSDIPIAGMSDINPIETKPIIQSYSSEIRPPYLEAEREQELLMSRNTRNLAEEALQNPYPSTLYKNNF